MMRYRTARYLTLVPALAEAEDFLQQVAVFGGVVAGFRGRGSGQEGRIETLWACGVAEQIADLVDGDNIHALGRGELVGVGVLRQLNGLLHELGPDGRGGVSAFDVHVGVAVVAQPPDYQLVAYIDRSYS